VRDVILNRLRRCACIIYILIGFASDYIEMYIKPNTTAEVFCPYKGNQTAPITWRNSYTFFVVRDMLGDGEGKFRISSHYGADLFKITSLTYSPLLFTGMSRRERSEETS
jgi:hypothetical protein